MTVLGEFLDCPVTVYIDDIAHHENRTVFGPVPIHLLNGADAKQGQIFKSMLARIRLVEGQDAIEILCPR